MTTGRKKVHREPHAARGSRVGQAWSSSKTNYVTRDILAEHILHIEKVLGRLPRAQFPLTC